MEGLINVDNKLLRSLGLVISDPERVLICTHRSCGYALQVHDKRVSRHLWEKHKVPKASRRSLDRVVESFKLSDPRLLGPRPHGSAPHPHLQISNGYHCRRCNYLTISSKLRQQHRCTAANLSNVVERERDNNSSADVLLQSWVKEGTRTYWIVNSEHSSTLSAPGPAPDSTQHGRAQREPSRLEQLCQAERTRLVEHREATRDEELPDLTTTSPWMKRTEWPTMHRGVDRGVLVRMATLPDVNSRTNGRYLGVYDRVQLQVSVSGERRISVILRAIEELYTRCEETVQHTARPILCKLYSQSQHASSQRPFRLVNRPSTRSKYLRVIKKLFSFLLSFYSMDRALCHLVVNFHLTGTQRNAIGRLWDSSCWTSQDLPSSVADENSEDEEGEDITL